VVVWGFVGVVGVGVWWCGVCGGMGGCGGVGCVVVWVDVVVWGCGGV
jgi:hypothetical protein